MVQYCTIKLFYSIKEAGLCLHFQIVFSSPKRAYLLHPQTNSKSEFNPKITQNSPKILRQPLRTNPYKSSKITLFTPSKITNNSTQNPLKPLIYKPFIELTQKSSIFTKITSNKSPILTLQKSPKSLVKSTLFSPSPEPKITLSPKS